jgi:hypothetical protein
MQICPVPQAMPTGAGPDGAHTGRPVAQRIVPSWQATPGLHAVESAQAMQPASGPQTWPAPHAVPGSYAPVSTHSPEPEPHEIDPTRHGEPVKPQRSPASHASQPPSRSQMKPGPHEVPGCANATSAQPASAQVRWPMRHSAFGVQVAPSLQSCTQVPPRQSSPTGHVTPTQSGSTHAPLMQACHDGHAMASHEVGTHVP